MPDELRARASTVGAWESFTLTWVSSSSSCVGIVGANGDVVTAELGYPAASSGLLRDRSTSIGSWEELEITPT